MIIVLGTSQSWANKLCWKRKHWQLLGLKCVQMPDVTIQEIQLTWLEERKRENFRRNELYSVDRWCSKLQMKRSQINQVENLERQSITFFRFYCSLWTFTYVVYSRDLLLQILWYPWISNRSRIPNLCFLMLRVNFRNEYFFWFIFM